MSTPVNQIIRDPNFNTAQPKMDDDPLIMGVIDEMEQEVSRAQQSNHSQQQQQHQQQQVQQQDVRTVNVASFRNENQPPSFNQQGQYMYQQNMHASNPTPPKYMQPPKNKDQGLLSLFEWNQDDAIIAVAIALVAYAILSYIDVSFIYEKYIVLSTFQPYDMYIKIVLLAMIIYLVVRKFKA